MTIDIIEQWIVTHMMIVYTHGYLLMIEFSVFLLLSIIFGVFALPWRVVLLNAKNKDENAI